MVNAWGREEADAFFAASQSEAFRTARLRFGAPPEGAIPVAGIADAYELPTNSLVPENMTIQDGSSISVGWALDPQGGDRILDLAAAPGGKSLHIADQLNGQGVVIASDAHLRRVNSAARRWPDTPVRWCAADGRRAPYRSRSFDRVLVDAPCSGLGTLRRRPEVRYRVDEGGLAALAALQRRMLAEALRVVRPGGVIVYSVCTVTPEETVAIIDGLRTEPLHGLPGRMWGGGWLLGPHLTGTDGMFITRIKG
jgi:16S rRNA (cytosine967-C5)-methyltransferase